MFTGNVVNISCGFAGASANLTVPDWLIGKRDLLPTKNFYNGSEIVNNSVSNMKWIPDLNSGRGNATNSKLSVGPVDMTYNGSTYQCLFSFSGGTVYSNVAVLTVIVNGMYI